MSENNILEFKPRPKPDPMAGVNVFGINEDGKVTINGNPVDVGSSGYSGFIYKPEVQE